MMPIETAKSIVSFSTAGTLFIADSIVTEVPGVPQWITSLGFPIAMLVAVIYALISVHKAHAASVAGRLADKDLVISALVGDQEKALKSREDLTAATREQTSEFRTLGNEIKSLVAEVRSKLH